MTDRADCSGRVDQRAGEHSGAALRISGVRGGELARRRAVGSSRWLGRAQRGPASGWEQPPPVEPTRTRRLNREAHLPEKIVQHRPTRTIADVCHTWGC